MNKSKINEIILTGTVGIIGAVVGSTSTVLISAYSNDKQQHSQAILDTYKYDQISGPVEFIRIKQLIDEMHNLTIESSDTINRIAQINKKYPNCANTFSDECRAMLVETIQVLRDETGADKVSSENIDMVIRGKYEAARKAALILNGK